MIINAEDYGIIPNQYCTKQLIQLLRDLRKTDEEKTVIFRKGTYLLTRKHTPKIYRAITNTCAPEEYENKGDIFWHRTPFLFENIKNLTFDGQGSTFLIEGKMTNMIVTRCENVKIKNLRISVLRPNLHKLTVVKQSPFTVTYQMDEQSMQTRSYRHLKKGRHWHGYGYTLGYTENCIKAYWTNTVLPEDSDTNFRTAHPLLGAYYIRENRVGKIRVRYFLPKKHKVGQTFYIFDAQRDEVGVLIDDCKGVTLDGYEQNFNYALGVVGQVSEDITIENCRFAPDRDGEMEMASLADFTHFCMCMGKVTVRNTYFSGAGDDAINIHGIHFIVDKVEDNDIIISFRHPQAWGFNPHSAGDEIEFINPETLISEPGGKIVVSEMVDSHHIKLSLDKAVDKKFEGMAVENVNKCPSLLFEGNTVKNLATRGVLYTSRGKCVIRNNHFISCKMSGVLLSDDANNWYESGMCKDVLIENNVFDHCGDTPILIKPENKRHAGYIHENIKIIGNTFKKYDGVCIKARSSKYITVRGNIIPDGKKIETVNCENVEADF